MYFLSCQELTFACHNKLCYIYSMKPNFAKISQKPGIYFFLNKNKEIIYIGKAKNLQNRIKSYWTKSAELSPAKQQMISEVYKINYTIVDNEVESLLLEAEQIRKQQPKYNISLKDDKNWGYILIHDEPFPRVSVVHGRQQRRGQYFGPYTSTQSARVIVKMLHRILALRTCRRDLSKLPKGKVCLEYHMGRCLGPCEKLVDIKNYNQIIKQVKNLLNGHTKNLADNLRKQIIKASHDKNYELAKLKRDQLLSLQRLQDKQKIIRAKNINQDIINLVNAGQVTIITLMQVRAGILGDKFNFKINNKLNLDNKNILENFINQFYARGLQAPKEIILPTKITQQNILIKNKTKFIIPQRGQNKQLLELIKQNAQDYLEKNLTNKNSSVLLNLQKLLKLPDFPNRIEVYDISNIQGQYAVGSMIVFTDGKIDSDQYRIFKIKGIKQANDTAMLKQVLQRRAKHDEWPDPDLIILDGGKPQLNIVYPALPKDWQTRVIALAKKQEEIFIPKSSKSLKLPKNNPISLFIQHMRNQAHRFAINHYRRQHRKSYK